MATQLAIVYGEWQLDPDQEIRLYVRPTLTLIDRAGDTHYVPAFGYPYPGIDFVHQSKTGDVFLSTTYARNAFGGEYREGDPASNKKWLEPLIGKTIHNLGELTSFPVMPLLVMRTNVCIDVLDMSADAVCIDDTYPLGLHDGPIIEKLKRFRLGNV